MAIPSIIIRLCIYDSSLVVLANTVFYVGLEYSASFPSREEPGLLAWFLFHQVSSSNTVIHADPNSIFIMNVFEVNPRIKLMLLIIMKFDIQKSFSDRPRTEFGPGAL